MGEKKGDQQSRAELLGKLLGAAGFQPYMLRHGTGRDTYYLILLRLKDDEGKALDDALGEPAPRVKVGPMQMVALPVEAKAKIGAVEAKYYNAEQQSWTASMAVARFK